MAPARWGMWAGRNHDPPVCCGQDRTMIYSHRAIGCNTAEAPLFHTHDPAVAWARFALAAGFGAKELDQHRRVTFDTSPRAVC
jgi:hypothetical protein